MTEYRIWMVYNLTENKELSIHDDSSEAHKQARIAAEARVGKTIVVLAVEEGFRASVSVGRCFVDYAPRVADVQADPPPPETPSIDPGEADGPTEF